MDQLTNAPNTGHDPQEATLASQAASGANWFYWIAGLTLINSVMALIKADFSFVLGLFTTTLFDFLGGNTRFAAAKGICFLINLVAIGFYVGLGYGANRRMGWVFITGFILYALDTGLMLLLGLASGEMGSMIISGLFHLWALSGIWRGMKANSQLSELLARKAYMSTQPPYQNPTLPA